MTYGDIVKIIAQNARIDEEQARVVADYYWHCGVLRREHGGIKITDEIYFSRPMIFIALGDARQEVCE